MIHCFGLHASDKFAEIVDVEAANLSQALGQAQFTTQRDFWLDLDPGPLDPTSSARDRKRRLIDRALRSDIPQRVLREFLRSRTGIPQALGMTVPYAMGPLAREAAAMALLQSRGRAGLDAEESAFDRVSLLETPCAVGLSLQAQARWGGVGLVTPGCGRWELTVLMVEPQRLAVVGFREPPPGTEADALLGLWHRLSVDMRPREWLTALPAGAEQSRISAVAGVCRQLGCELRELAGWSTEAAICAARFAFQQLKKTSASTLPALERVSPRSIGLLAGNARQELFWRRLTAAGSASPSSHALKYTESATLQPVDVESSSIAPALPTILTACVREGSADHPWLSLAQSAGALQWWQEEVAPIRASGSAALEQTLRLETVHDQHGWRMAAAHID